MSSGGEDGWSEPALYSGGQPVFAPRTFTEADPMAPLLIGDWEAREDGAAQWGTTTYIGPRRLRPGPAPAGAAVRADRDEAADKVAAGEPATGRDRGLMANSRTMALASLVSRITGFLRTIALLAALGTGAVANNYNAGNTFPNMVYELLLGGVLSSVLIPLLVHAEESDADGGVAYTQRLLSIAAAVLGVLTLVSVACAPLIAGYFAPADQRSLTTLFATLLLPEIFFYGLGAMFMAVLNIKHVYAPGAWAPVLNNIVVIVTLGVFWLLPGPATLNPDTITDAQILVLGIGTTLGIAVQAFVLLPYLRRVGFRWQWRFRARPNEVGRLREVGVLAGWVLGYVVASQLGVAVIQKVGLSNGGLTVFTNVDLLFQMPYGILVVSLLTAIMPRMSRAAVRGDTATVIADLRLGTRLSGVALVPVTAGLIALAVPLCVTLFAYGRTDIGDAQLLGSALALSAFGLFPFAVVMLQLRVFYALRDGRTPTIINACMVALKIVLVLVTSAVFRAPHGTNVSLHPSVHAVEWLNISTSLSYLLGAVVGHVLLTRRLGNLGFTAVAATVARMVVAAAAGGAVAYGLVVGCRHLLGGGHAGSAAGLVAGGAVGLVVLAAVCIAGRFPEVRELRAMVRG